MSVLVQISTIDTRRFPTVTPLVVSKIIRLLSKSASSSFHVFDSLVCS